MSSGRRGEFPRGTLKVAGAQERAAVGGPRARFRPARAGVDPGPCDLGRLEVAGAPGVGPRRFRDLARYLFASVDLRHGRGHQRVGAAQDDRGVPLRAGLPRRRRTAAGALVGLEDVRDVREGEVVRRVQLQRPAEGAQREVPAAAERHVRGIAANGDHVGVVVVALAQVVPGFHVRGVGADQRAVCVARLAPPIPRLRELARDQRAFPLRQRSPEPRSRLSVAHALGGVRADPAVDDAQLVVGERESRVELQGAVEAGACRVEVPRVERGHADHVLLVRAERVGADGGAGGPRRRFDVEDPAREAGEHAHQRVGAGGLLADGAEALAGADVEHLGDDLGPASHLEEVAHDELPRPGPARHGEPRLKAERLLAARLAHVAHQVGDALVVDDADVLPLGEVEVEQVHARVAQPVDVLGAGDVLEGEDDPGTLVERRVGAPRRHGRGAPAGRRRAVRALRVQRAG